MRWLACIAFAVMHAACSSNAPMPDAQMVDASTGGLVVELVAKGGVPQMPTSNVEINYVLIRVKTIRAIGDAAPGDLRTTRTDEPGKPLKPLEWKDTPTGPVSPIPHLFPLAPPGMYSTIELRIDDSSQSASALEINGNVVRGGNLVPFQVQSRMTEMSVEVAVNTVLPPRALATATISVDVAALIEDVDWDMVPLTGEGRLFIGDGDPNMADVVSELATAFKSAN